MTQIELETYTAVKNAARDYTRKNESINWEQRRYEIAKDCLSHELANSCHDYLNKEENVAEAIEYADLLIAALRKQV